MKLFEIRLADHHSRNAFHLKNLHRFMADTDRFNRLDLEDRRLLTEQVKHMESLNKVLESRMKRLNLPI